MMSEIGSKILSICSWIFGIMFALIGILAIFQEGFFIGLLMFIGAVLLLPPTKRRLISKTPKLSKGKLSAIGSAAIISSVFGFSEPQPVPSSSSAPQMLSSENNKQENVAEESLVETESSNQDQSTNITDNPFRDTDEEELTTDSTDTGELKEPKPVLEEPKPVLTVVEEPKPKPEPVKENPKPVVNNSCSGLPKTCGKMNSCEQAYQALECGNRRLDKDKDGVPCESICQ